MADKKKTRWMRYFHKFSSGKDKEPSYVLCPSDLDEDNKSKVRDFILEAELCSSFEGSEHYRGIDYEFVDKPDANWLKWAYKEARDRAEGAAKYAAFLEGLL